MTDTPSPDQTLREDFLKALADDFADHGVAAIVAYREEKPADYLKIIVSILPKELSVSGQRGGSEDLSDDELLARIRALDGVIAALTTGGNPAAGSDTKPESQNPTPISLPPLP